MPDRSRIVEMVGLCREPAGYVLSVRQDPPLPLGLEVHKGERDALVRRLMAKSSGIFLRGETACRFDLSQVEEARRLHHDLMNGLLKVANKPISQKRVESILGIASDERIRWGKDGRLPRSGMSKIRRGANEISLWTYPADAIEILRDNPKIIALWRMQDAAG